ncbi:DUF3037 domain-containing protein [Sphingomonas sp.]|jgi:hypothetical protein|uniref:DUF3037 domain-containing protein n=1 Tax=Sphingomonas sp. TaxID=28214 RepID=UPI002628B3CA|nr:DUF3037 domain-containing protein [Sphingomonas sp.]MDF2494240.1 hypothetical protein [Sphingomonas sp.]
MEHHQGKYALVQFCPVPERLEFLNIGLVLIVPGLHFVGVRFARGHSRIDRVFGRQPKSYLNAIKHSFESRLRSELWRSPTGAGFEEFVQKRANDIRVSRLLPVQVSDAEADFDRLFDELVGEEDPVVREPRVRRKLRDAFRKHKVEQFLESPEEVDLPEYGLKVSVPYGYQNGCYNLIDGMRVPSNVSDGLREAGKRSMEGGLIWRHFEQGQCKRLVVVGDFSQQPNAFYHAVKEQFDASHVRLHRLDDMRPLLNDILDNAEEHRKLRR